MTVERQPVRETRQSPAFFSRDLDAFANSVVETLRIQSNLFCTINVAAGVTGMKLTAITCCYQNGEFVVVDGLEIGMSTVADRKDVLLAHIDKLRKRPQFAGCRIVVCIEQNFGETAQDFCTFLRENVYDVAIVQDDDGSDGLRIRRQRKESCVYSMNSYLNESRVKFYVGVPRLLRERILRQLRAYTRFTEFVDGFAEGNVRFSGKHTGCDSLACTLQLALLATERFVALSK